MPPDVEMVLIGPSNYPISTHINAEPICEASCRYLSTKSTDLLDVNLTDSLADEARAFNLRFTEAERLVRGYIDLLASTTEHQLRRAVEKNGEALQAMIAGIMRKNPSRPRSSGLSEVTSGSITTPLPAPSTELEGKDYACTP